MPKTNTLPQLPAASTTSSAVSADLTIVAPGNFDDAEMARQLGEQYSRAVGGMREVLIFGAMMMQLEKELSARGQLKVGRPAKGESGGVSEWLETHRPEINRSTAYRFKTVAEAIQNDFKVPAKITFTDLVMLPSESLTEPLRLKQQELFDYVDGTSQRSWMDKFKPRHNPGGWKGGPKKIEDSDDEPLKLPHGMRPDEFGIYKLADHEGRYAMLIWQETYHFLETNGLDEKSWAHLPDPILRKLKGILVDLNRLIPTK